jgi:hypothetical protein
MLISGQKKRRGHDFSFFQYVLRAIRNKRHHFYKLLPRRRYWKELKSWVLSSSRLSTCEALSGLVLWSYDCYFVVHTHHAWDSDVHAP